MSATDPSALVRRYRSALSDALEALFALGRGGSARIGYPATVVAAIVLIDLGRMSIVASIGVVVIGTVASVISWSVPRA